MQMKFYCDLYVSECWQKKKEKIIKKLKRNRIQPQVYVVALSQGDQNELEFFSSILLKQHVFDNTEVLLSESRMDMTNPFLWSEISQNRYTLKQGRLISENISWSARKNM